MRHDTGDERDQRIAATLEAVLSETRSRAVLGVSGGPDSTALMHAAAACATGRLHVATVDHGLRPESQAEAAAVGRAADGLGLPHRILAWDTGARPASGIQAAARAARYRLLAAFAAEVGASLLLTAHTLDDQAETVLMRLFAGSGLAGLAGMRPERTLGRGLRLVRPFLGIPKAELVAWCEDRHIAYLHDPSNADERFTRARLRRLMPELAREGLNTGRLVRLAERAARDEAALQGAARERLAALRLSSPEGGFRLSGSGLIGHPEAVTLRLIERAMDAAGAEGPRRLERLERLTLDTLLPAVKAGRPARRTLRGLIVDVARNGDITLSPAPERRRGTATTGAPEPPCELLGKGTPPPTLARSARMIPPRRARGPGQGTRTRQGLIDEPELSEFCPLGRHLPPRPRARDPVPEPGSSRRRERDRV
ncbi:tRNA lysidine(34) synthetase TilS [Methylobacterium durans]|uniref:tRNA lysidine(34) synthetase TilS n=1 Tax=Methylobacterium durans TaxID=2202825 RepID=UPI0013A5A9DC|nr:tRNA lysidine(34) synthetase TilS [Methylobacterium durans]